MSTKLRLANALVIFVMLLTAFYGPSVKPAQAASPNVVISQVYGGGGNAGATLKNDFVELFNRGTAPVSLSGWSIQYAPATTAGLFGSSDTAITLLSDFTLQPGQYYLVQEAPGAGGTVDLPTPDVIDTTPIAMSGTGGKVALVNSVTALGCNGGSTVCPPAALATIVDLVGYGNANFYEGSGATPAPSNTFSVIRQANGCYDTDNNAADFVVSAVPPTPRNSASPTATCTAATNPSGVGLAAPTSVLPGQITLLTVAVTPGANPTSTTIAVKADLTAIGGAAAQSFYDDATHGDVTASDSTFSFQATPALGTAPAPLSLPVTITDAQVRSGSASIALTILPPLQVTAISMTQSTDQSTWTPVNGNLAAGYRMSLDPSVPFYYLGVGSLTSNRPLLANSYPFTLDTANLPAGFYEYWNGKGVNAGASSGWQAIMWQIINGDLPMFFLKVSPTAPNYMLVDGLKSAMSVTPDENLAVNGDYPLGTFKFNGTVQDAIGGSSAMVVGINFSAPAQITTLTLNQAVDPSGTWLPVAGTYAQGFNLPLAASNPFYYLNINTMVISPTLQDGYHPFYLDVSSVPANFYTYWDGKGVNASASSGWQPVMWQIINGKLPMFFINVMDGSPAYMLVDGLKYALGTTPDQYLAVSGDYPAGLYKFNGDLTDENGDVYSLPVSITFQVNAPMVLTSPSVVHAYEGIAATAQVKAKDPDGVAISAAITAGAPAGITLQNVTPATTIAGDLSADLMVASNTPAGTFNVEITFTNNDPFPQTTPITIQVIVTPAACPTPDVAYPLNGISAVQGSGVTSPLNNQKVTVRGQVTGAFMTSAKLNGFFVQDAGDGDVTTSDGIFVYASAYSTSSINPGDWVQVSGSVSEYNGLTELTPPATNGIAMCGNAPAITPVSVSLPVPAAVAGVDYLERYEGMLINVAQTLTVTETYNLARYNEILTSVDGRLYYTKNDPDQTRSQANSLYSITIDDGRTAQNPNPLYYLQGLGPDRTLRIGSTIPGVTGNLTTISSAFKVEPTTPVTFDTSVNPRPVAPAAIGGDLKVAGFNVFNYFTTLNATPYPNGSPYGGSNTPRGAYTAAELVRQTDKLVQVIRGTGADVIGVFEVEKWAGANAAQTLVEAVNAGLAVDSPDRFAVAPDPNNGFGGDFIKQSIFYKPAKVSLVPGGNLSANDPIFDRFPVAQEFQSVANGERFFVVMNHLKSKSSCPSDPTSPDAEHGQGCWNAKRITQANALITFINTVLKPLDPDVLVMGDLNAYGLEDPIATLKSGGLVNEVSTRVTNPLDRYSYVYNGEAGYLDHSLASSSMDMQIKGVTIWHVNADEPTAIDYSMRYKTDDPYVSNQYRASDHDPIITGVSLFTNHAPVVGQPIADKKAFLGKQTTFTFADNTFSDADVAQGDSLTYTAALADGSPLPAWLTFDAGTRTFSGNPANLGALTIKVTATDKSGASISTTFTLTVNVTYIFPIIYG
jgi:uncharacterized protein